VPENIFSYQQVLYFDGLQVLRRNGRFSLLSGSIVDSYPIPEGYVREFNL
jgi:hypothetical protein